LDCIAVLGVKIVQQIPLPTVGCHPRLTPPQDYRHCYCTAVFNKLHQLQILQTANLEALADSITCNSKSKECMYKECSQCRSKAVPLSSFDHTTDVTYLQWQTTRDKGNEHSITSTVPTAQLLFIIHKAFTSDCPTLTRIRQ